MKTLLNNYLNLNPTDEDFEKLSEILIHTQLDDDRKKKWTDILRNKYGVEKPADKPNSIIRKFYLGSLAIMAIFFIVFFAIEMFGQNKIKKRANHFVAELNIMADPSAFRKGSSETDEIRVSANKYYVSKNYDKSIETWEKLRQNNNATEVDLFYLALSYLKKNNGQSSLTIEILKSLKTENFKDEKNWILCLAYIQSNDFFRSEVILDSIIKNKSYKYKSAQELKLLQG